MTQNLLADYSKELNLNSVFLLQDLIDSHRYLRERQQHAQAESREQLERYRKIGTEQGYASVTHGEYIAISKLKTMTLAELVNFIGTED